MLAALLVVELPRTRLRPYITKLQHHHVSHVSLVVNLDTNHQALDVFIAGVHVAHLMNIDYAYKGNAKDNHAVQMRMREIASSRVHFGCERVFVVLRREGWRDNHKRGHRIYKEEGLSSRHCRPRRSRSACRRRPIKVAVAPNARWGMDFVSDALFDGRRFLMLTVVDHFTHECLVIVVDQSLRGEHVAEAMTRLAAQRGSPGAIGGQR